VVNILEGSGWTEIHDRGFDFINIFGGLDLCPQLDFNYRRFPQGI